MSETTAYPCPRCRVGPLTYDGIVRWRSGRRPPRSLARPREQLGNSPRGDYDESAYYHCQNCGTEFIDPLMSSRGPLRLQEAGGGPVYVYDKNAQTWQKRRW